MTDSWLCIYHLFVWSILNFLHNYQWNTFLTQLCVVFYSFCEILLVSFSHQRKLVVFYWYLILSDLQNYSQYPDRSQQSCRLNGLNSSSSSLFFQYFFQAFWTVPSAPTTSSITVTLMFHSFSVLEQIHSTCLFFHFLSFLPSSPLEWKKFTRHHFFYLLAVCLVLAGSEWSVRILKSQRILCRLFSRRHSGLFTYHLTIWPVLISWTIPSGSSFPPSHACSWIPFGLVCCIRLLCD